MAEEKRQREVKKRSGKRKSYLAAVPRYPVHDIFVCDFGEATALPCSLIVGISFAQPLGAIVEAIAKRLMYALESITTSHENLDEALCKRIARTGCTGTYPGARIKHCSRLCEQPIVAGGDDSDSRGQ